MEQADQKPPIMGIRRMRSGGRMPERHDASTAQARRWLTVLVEVLTSMDVIGSAGSRLPAMLPAVPQAHTAAPSGRPASAAASVAGWPSSCASAAPAVAGLRAQRSLAPSLSSRPPSSSSDKKLIATSPC